jgi:hypothetical protein
MSSDSESRSSREEEEDEFVNPTQMINDANFTKALEAAASGRAMTPPPQSPAGGRPPSRGKGYLGLGLSPARFPGKGPRKEARVEEEEEDAAAPFAPIAIVPSVAPSTDMVLPPVSLPSKWGEMDAFAAQLTAHSLIRGQQMMQAMVHEATKSLLEFNKKTEQRIMHNVNVVGRKLDELQQQITEQADRVEAMKNLDARTVVEFLVRFGMDTRIGYVCGLPMHIEDTVYVVVCIPLLGYAMKRLFPAVVKKHGLSNPNVSKIISRLDPVTLTFDKDVQRDVIKNQMSKVFGVRDYAPSAPVGDKWAVFTVEQFLRMLRDLRRQNETLDAAAVTPYAKIKYTSGDRVVICRESATTPKMRNKMAWAMEVQNEVLSLPSIKEFFVEVYRARGEQAPDLSRPFHFCGDVPDFDKPVLSHAALRDMWRREQQRLTKKRRRDEESEEEEEEEEEADNDSGARAHSSEEETEEQPPPRSRAKAPARKKAPPAPKRTFHPQKAVAYRASKRVPTGDDDSEVLA